METYKVKTEGTDRHGRLRHFFRELFERGKIRSVFTLLGDAKVKRASMALVSEPAFLEGMDPFIPVQSVNAATLVSEITRNLPEGEVGTIALVLRPCEVRAVIELEKLRQVNLSRCILVGFDCPGTLPVKEFHSTLGSVEMKELTVSIMNQVEGTSDERIRRSCSMCDQFTCTGGGDINIAWMGMEDDEVYLDLLSQRGKNLLDGLDSRRLEDTGSREAVLETIRGRKTQNQPTGIEPLFELLAPCIRCYNCREVCPICYCRECLLTPEKMGYTSDRHFQRAMQRGKLAMPVDVMLYHLTKMNHMASSCVACGICEQACPSGIPLGTIYNLMSREVQSLLSYRAGRDRKEELPVVTYKEDELREVEDGCDE